METYRINESDTLENQLKFLAETLEDKPDTWFDNPSGWLRKPNFERKEQERGFVPSKSNLIITSKRIWFGSPFSKYFFSLDIKGNKLKYFKDSKMLEEKGLIDLRIVSGVAVSKVVDVPPNSLDLIANDRYYTIICESYIEMVRWAFAIEHSRKNNINRQSIDKSLKENNRFQRFEVTFPTKSQLHMNVMGSMNRNSKNGNLVKHWMVVVGFEKTETGGPGLAEQCGKISKKDFIESVNGRDITLLTFDEAMDLIAKASWPLTLQFIRDRNAAIFPCDIEGWGAAYYPSLYRRRRRYLELRDNELSFKKPAPGGSAMSQREAFISLELVDSVKLFQDLNLPEDQQYIIRLICKENAVINHFDDCGNAMGTSEVSELELFFKKLSNLESWCSKITECTSPSPLVDPLSIIQVQSAELVAVESTRLAIWSELTGRFAARIFSLSDGVLSWHRPSTAKYKSRRVRLFEASCCYLTSIAAVEDLNEMSVFKFQIRLGIERWDELLIIGFEDITLINIWLAKLKDAIDALPEESRIFVPQEMTKTVGSPIKKRASMTSVVDEQSTTCGDQDEEENVNNSGDTVLEGYLFKKGDISSLSETLGISTFKRRWFVLRDMELLYYKTRLQARSGEKPSGCIDLRYVFQVVESEDPTMPENSIEIRTPTRIYVMVADDEEWQSRWLEALGDAVEARQEVIAESAETEAEMQAARLADMTRMVKHCGTLLTKSSNRIIGHVTWKEYYFVLTPGAFTQYDKEADFLDTEVDCLLEIPLITITHVETTADARNGSGSAFEIRCHVKERGDSQGMKTYFFEAKSFEAAKEWMTIICESTKSLILVPKDGDAPGLMSQVSEDMQLEIRRKSMMKKLHVFSMSPQPASPGPSSDSTSSSCTSSPPVGLPARPLSMGGRGPSFRGGGRSRPTSISSRSNSSFNPDFLGTG